MTATHVARGSSHGMKLMQGSSAMRGNPRGRRFVEAVGRMRIKSLDDMAEREMAKQQQRSKQGKFTSAKEFDELVKAMPDPAGEQDGLLADGAWRVLRGVFCVLRSVFYVLCSMICVPRSVTRVTCYVTRVTMIVPRGATMVATLQSQVRCPGGIHAGAAVTALGYKLRGRSGPLPFWWPLPGAGAACIARRVPRSGVVGKHDEHTRIAGR
jgi:hypothetical protein